MSEVSDKWSEVGQQLEALALKLRTHFEQTGRGEEAAEPLQKIKASVNEAFESAGAAVRDEAVRSDVRDTGRLFLDAMSATFARAAEVLRERAGSSGPSEPPPPPIESNPAE